MEKDPSDPTTDEPVRDVGLMPAFMAILMICAIGMLVACGIGSWFVFSKSPTLVSGTLRAHFIPLVEQSNLDPSEKKLVVNSLNDLVENLDAGQWEPYQANQLMHNLIRAPIVQWGDLDAIEQIIARSDSFDEEEKKAASRAVFRLKYGAGEDKITANDVEDAIKPVTVKDDSERGCHLSLNVSVGSLKEVLHRFDLLLEREKIPEEVEEVRLSDVVRMQIEKARTE